MKFVDQKMRIFNAYHYVKLLPKIEFFKRKNTTYSNMQKQRYMIELPIPGYIYIYMRTVSL